MKVFFCETCDDGTVGGSHSCMYNLIRNVDKTRIQCTVGFYFHNVYVPRYQAIGVDVEILPFEKPFHHSNVLYRKAVNWYRRDYRFKQCLREFLQPKGFDLIVLNNSIYASLPFVQVCKQLRIPVVAYERGLLGHFEPRHVRATGDIQASIPISDAVLEFIRKGQFQTPIVQRIYDGIDPSAVRSSRSPSEIKKSLEIPAESRLVGIIGNIRPWKGHRYFLESFFELSRLRLDLYGLVVGGWGEEDEKFQADLVTLVEKEGLSHRLKFLGYRTDIPDLLSILDVFVHSSIKPEPFGMVLLEAMAAKRPIVATNFGGPLEILNKGECGLLVPPKDSKSMFEACRRYLDDPAFAQKMADAAYRRLLGQYPIDQTVKKTTELYFRVVELHRAGRI